MLSKHILTENSPVKQDDAEHKIVKRGRHFKAPSAVEGIGSCCSNCEGTERNLAWPWIYFDYPGHRNHDEPHLGNVQ